jgi:hypothetical protein
LGWAILIEDFIVFFSASGKMLGWSEPALPFLLPRTNSDIVMPVSHPSTHNAHFSYYRIIQYGLTLSKCTFSLVIKNVLGMSYVLTSLCF